MKQRWQRNSKIAIKVQKPCYDEGENITKKTLVKFLTWEKSKSLHEQQAEPELEVDIERRGWQLWKQFCTLSGGIFQHMPEKKR